MKMLLLFTFWISTHYCLSQTSQAEDRPENGFTILTLAKMIEDGFVDAKERQGELKQYETDLTLFIKDYPKSKNAFMLRGYVRKVRGNYVLAMQDFRKEIELGASNEASPYKNIGDCKSELNDYYGAQESYQVALRYLDKNFPVASAKIYGNLAYVQVRLNELEEAFKNVSLAISLDSKYAYFTFLRGLIYIELHDKEKGCLDLSKAGELGYVRAYEIIKEICN